MAIFKEMQKIPQMVYDDLVIDCDYSAEIARNMPIKCTNAAVIREMVRRGFIFIRPLMLLPIEYRDKIRLIKRELISHLNSEILIRIKTNE